MFWHGPKLRQLTSGSNSEHHCKSHLGRLRKPVNVERLRNQCHSGEGDRHRWQLVHAAAVRRNANCQSYYNHDLHRRGDWIRWYDHSDRSRNRGIECSADRHYHRESGFGDCGKSFCIDRDRNERDSGGADRERRQLIYAAAVRRNAIRQPDRNDDLYRHSDWTGRKGLSDRDSNGASESCTHRQRH